MLPSLAPHEAWAIGLIVVLAVLRPVARLGWTVAGVVVAGAVGVMAATTGVGDLMPARWLVLPWLALAVVLAAAAAGSPLRWEPRTGPSAATALAFGAILVHLAQAWLADGGALAHAGEAWVAGDLPAADLTADAAAPLTLPFIWLLSRLPGVDAAAATGVLTLAAAAGLVIGAGHLARGWGYTGTGRATMAAVAWAPPLLLAHVHAPVLLIAGVALVWAWWALGEVWAGRHLPSRMAVVSGALLGVAVGTALWPLLVGPLWIRRLSGRKLAWFLVGLLGAMVVSVAALVPTGWGVGDLWRAVVLDPIEAADLGIVLPLALAVVALAGAAPRVPLSPTRLSAATGAILALASPWWPTAWQVTGPVLAVPFVILAAVAPDRPQEHWPPDAPLPLEDVPAGVGR